ncbi:RNB3L protein, partial [Corythaixoides concolor]|nr:RNB3L protein [Corythaixoides concolor]
SDTTLAQKRGRSSSFTIFPTFPPFQPVKKNNVFMTSALLRRNPDLIKRSLSQSQLRNVIRPAILQPPQGLTCPENPVVSLITKEEVRVQLSEDSFHSSAENSLSSKTAARSSVTMNPSSSETAQSQLFEDRRVQNSSNSDFVFGENMVERVLVRYVSAGRLFFCCPKNIPCTERISFIFFPTETALLRNATLFESAAACISKPVKKILLDEVITGEEAEHNVLQINYKLFVFNKLSLTWIESDRGSLRFNDISSNICGMFQSRLTLFQVTSGMLVLLCCHFWYCIAQFQQIICFFGLYAFYVLQARSKDTEYLYAAIHHRLVALRSLAEQEPDANQVDTESETAFQPLNCDSDDEDDEK